MAVVDLSKNIAAFDEQKEALRSSHGDKWALFFDGAFEGAFTSYDRAMSFALNKFGDTDFLLRRIVERPVTIPMLLADR